MKKLVKGMIIVVGVSIVGALLVKTGINVGFRVVEQIKEDAIIEYKESQEKDAQYKYEILKPLEPTCEWIHAQEGTLI
jgi:hypothetical protein